MNKQIEVQAPNPLVFKDGYITIFLAGSIEMGNAEKWQEKIIKSLKNEQIIFFNPRRDDWDSSWEQKITNPEFKKQVSWELKALEASDIIIMYFDPNTKSPISLLELGLHAKSKKLIVFCPDGFWRKGNVDIVCERYNIKQVNNFKDLISSIKSLI